jgi:collagenase-like PrtC family protease
LLALCYVYLGEHELCLKHLDMAATAEPWKKSQLGEALFFAHLLPGPIYLALNLLTQTSHQSPWEPDFYKLSDDDVQEIRTSLSNIS